jgi:hypothetical protein
MGIKKSEAFTLNAIVVVYKSSFDQTTEVTPRCMGWSRSSIYPKLPQLLRWLRNDALTRPGTESGREVEDHVLSFYIAMAGYRTMETFSGQSSATIMHRKCPGIQY